MRSSFILCFLSVLIGLTVVSCGNKTPPPDWETYTSKDHLYRIQYPVGWQTALNGHAFTISTPDKTGLITVTGYVHDAPVFDQEAFRKMVMLDFVECREVTPFKPVTLNNWVGEDAVYTRWVNGLRINYLFRIAHRDQVGVFIAISEIDAHLQNRTPNFKQTMDSLVLLTPPVEKYIGKYGQLGTATPTPKKRPWQETLIDLIRATE